MADDLHPSMMRALPSVERLIGKRGTSFENAISSYPLCCPARATFLTGQYAHNHGAKGNNQKSGGGYRALIDPERNLAAWLQASGYRTEFAGKWLNGYRTPRRQPPGWDRWNGLVGAGGEGLSSFYDYEIFREGRRPRRFGSGPADYQTDALTTEYAVPRIERGRSDPAPFFVWLPYHPPHSGLGRDDRAGRRCSTGPPTSRKGSQSAIPPPRYANRFARARLPRPPSFGERNLSDKPAFLRREARLDRDDIKRIERDHRCGLAALLALDDAVERIHERLRDTGQLDETVFVFSADHGVLAGEHGQRRGKNLPYEEVLDVPLVMSGPGIAAGRTVAAPVANADLAPTILELARAPVPPQLARPIDGVSLVPQLGVGGGGGARVVPIEGRKNVARSRRAFKVRSYVGVRTARYAYVEHRRATYPTRAAGRAAPIGAGRLTDRELYDLERDPWQLRSRHASRQYAGAARTLAGLTSRLERCAGAACVVAAAIPGPGG